MHHDRRSVVLSLLLLTAACGNADDPPQPAHEDHVSDTREKDAGSASEQSAPLTYWQDMVPLFEQHCMQCHREGGIAPFRLDDYATVKPLAKLIARATSERTMPPWAVTSDGSCGTFASSEALSDDEIARIASWADSGAAEGEAAHVEVPELPSLVDAMELTTPEFHPVAQGGALTKFDEYRCFAVDLPDSTSGYITGYEVLPGNAQIVHHVAGFIVDPDAQADSDDGPLTNRERMQALHAQSPDRDGWECFGAAGEGVHTEASVVVWAPGQGIVNFPEGTGVPLAPHHQFVIQVHYNLSDVEQRGASDQTRVRLRLAEDVDEAVIFALEDPLLSSLYDDHPTTLPPRMSSTIYRWKETAREIGLRGDIEHARAKLYGVMPHMHGLGRKYQMTITQDGESPQCAAKVEHWDFHWQRMYFYQQPYTITPETVFEVSCDYDTSSVNEPVRPGWGTGNEMCLATLFLTVDKDTYKKLGR